jgi:predicted nucleic acid-binding protein
MSSPVCLDSSFVFKLLVEENGSEEASSLFERWLTEGATLVAPVLIAYEITSVLRKAVRRGRLTEGLGAESIDAFFRLNLTLHSARVLHQAALRLANELDLGAAYDAHFIALARILDCPLWTADDGMHAAAQRATVRTQLLGAA